jgi:putative drug exporter of the RND superfamily
VLSCALSAGLLVALAIPALHLHVAKPSNEALSGTSQPALASLAHVRAAFPGTAAPAILVVRGHPVARLRRLERLAVARGLVHPPFTVTRGTGGVSVELPLTGAGDNTASRRAIRILRRDLVPQAIPGALVTGVTAEDVDFTHQMKHAMPYVIGFVLAFAFVLLLFAFRSVVVPLKAIVLNLLSVAASYGVLVLVFRGEDIISWLPLFLFVILFGLSMDYHVFILSRVREDVDAGMTTTAAVRHGITATAGVVTSAALVMVGVFSLFGSLSSLELRQAGVGLATAVLLDATIVRAVLLPSTMTLLGDWNWYLPPALRRAYGLRGAARSRTASAARPPARPARRPAPPRR